MCSRSVVSRARARGSFLVEYLIVLGVLGLALATVLAVIVAPHLYKTYRKAQAAAAAPMP
jgi:Tfp pilus assembly protein FimT